MQRRQLGAALTGDAVASYLPAIEKLARSYLAKWAQQDSVDLESSVRAPLHASAAQLHPPLALC